MPGRDIQCKLWPRDDDERGRPSRPATTSTGCCTIDDLVRGDDVFFAATGVTDGELVRGRALRPRRRPTESLVMRSRSGTVRTLQATRSMDKLAEVAGARYQ